MDITLISPAGVMYRKGKGIFPRALRYAPLTLTTLAGLVPKDLEAKVQIVDEGVDKMPDKIEADIIGISAITGTAKRAYAMADHFRKQGTPVVLGGVHTTLMPDEAKQHADSIVTGLAFEAWPRLLRDFSQGKLEEVYSDTERSDLSGLPTPRRDLLKPFGYITNSSIQVTFGCPYRCDFCAVVATQKKYRHRPIDEVVEELEGLNGKFISMVDPSPIEDRQYAKDLYRAMIPLKKKWGGLATVRVAEDEGLLDLMAESGCKGILIGFETVSQDGANVINKGFNKVEKYKEVVKKVHDRGIAINGTFMFGMDTDTKDSFKQTVDFVNENNIDLPRYAIYTPFPGTPVFDRLNREGRIIEKNWSLYDGQHVVFKPGKLTPEELREGHLWAWEQTYSLDSIAKRTIGSGCSPLVSAITNLGYRYYATRLKNFPNEAMISLESEWNAPFISGEEPKYKFPTNYTAREEVYVQVEGRK